MPGAPVVTCPSGRYRGVRGDEVEIFRGIRYARPPVGALRLQAPRPLDDRPDELIDATRFGPAPPQVRPFYLSDVEDFSEDCLTLNIWRPVDRDRDRGLPVLVWLYGGGFKGGATAGGVYDGRTLARSGAVVVSVNYRVGALGFGCFAHRHPSLAEASNLGLRDVIAALQWIHSNIADFGGDPDAVCVAGQSAGGFLAGALLAAPSARGLFARLAPMSGGPYKVIEGASARAMGDELLEAVGVPVAESATAERLQSVPVASWVAAADRITCPDVGDRNAPEIRGLSIVDDHEFADGLLTGHPMVLGSDAPRAELLLTMTSDEIDFWSRLGPPHYRQADDFPALEAELSSWGIAPDLRRAVLEQYRGPESSADETRQRLLTDWIFHLPQARAAIRSNANGLAAWVAIVSVPGSAATGHFDDTAHLFGTAVGASDAQQQFGRLFRRMVIDFAAGHPVGWAPFVAADGEVCLLSDAAEYRQGQLASMLATWEGIDRP